MDSLDKTLFKKPLEECLQTTPQSKAHWLASVNIVVHDFTVVHGQTPTQLAITYFFPKVSNPTSTQPSSSMSRPSSLSPPSLSGILDHNAHEYDATSTWENDVHWNDPAVDFDPLYCENRNPV
eukprot:14227964-Ditylum_brightwellii.AAC.1